MMITIHVNRVERQLEIQERWSLLRVLREEFNLLGAKGACLTGGCGTCTVLVDGQPVRSCITLAKKVNAKRILTIEGVSNKNMLHPIQQAFIDAGAVQCGFCTPAMILSAKSLLDSDKNPSRLRIREAIQPNLCRCTGYQKIVDGIELAAKNLKNEE
jgi:aerobic carbon-monoxide dehydrogenase small subunit